MELFVFDVEVFPDYILFVFKKYKKDEYRIFDCYPSSFEKMKRELSDFVVRHIFDGKKSKAYICGFNILSFDLPILYEIVFHKTNFKKIQILKNNVIFKESGFKKYSEYIMNTKHIDLYKLNHWDSDARRASLKWVAANLRVPNVMNTPIDFNEKVNGRDDVVKKYCISDVDCTEKILDYSYDNVKMKYEVGKHFGLYLLSSSNTTMALKIIQKELTKRGVSFRSRKNNTLIEENIRCRDVLFPLTKEVSDKSIYNDILGRTISKDASFEYRYMLKNHNLPPLTVDIKKGGGHGCIGTGVYSSDDKYMILSADVKSYYPNITRQYRIYPKPLGVKFLDVYDWLYDERFKHPKGTSLNKAFKECLNATVGSSNQPGSFMYSPDFFYSITLNGQLMLVVLSEMLLREIPDSDILMFNTDGIEIRFPRKYKEKAMAICEKWQTLSKMPLEFDVYEKMYIWDVNNYIGVYEPEKVEEGDTHLDIANPKTLWFVEREDGIYKYKAKTKGRFVFDKGELDLHKNHSCLASKKAIFNNLVHGIPVLQTLTSIDDVFDFMIISRTNKNYHYRLCYLKDREFVSEFLHEKVLRFLITVSGYTIYRTGGKTETAITPKGKLATPCNDISVLDDDILDKLDMSYYVERATSEIVALNSQLKTTLF